MSARKLLAAQLDLRRHFDTTQTPARLRPFIVVCGLLGVKWARYARLYFQSGFHTRVSEDSPPRTPKGTGADRPDCPRLSRVRPEEAGPGRGPAVPGRQLPIREEIAVLGSLLGSPSSTLSPRLETRPDCQGNGQWKAVQACRAHGQDNTGPTAISDDLSTRGDSDASVPAGTRNGF